MTQVVGDSEKIESWATGGTIVEPSAQKIAAGWEQGEQPPHEYANWLANIIGQKVNHILQNGVPAWNNDTAYLENNFTSHEGVIYVARQDNTNSEPPNAEWQAVAPFPPQFSLTTSEQGRMQLVGDENEPAANSFYGTDEDGNRGWRSQADQGLATGDYLGSMAEGERPGYVRANGGTIGNATSAATERANADTLALFSLLWGKNSASLPVSGGRGSSAAADFAANKRITLPDAKNKVLAWIDGMGQAETDLLTGAVDGKQIGATGGAQSHQLTEEELAEHKHLMLADVSKPFVPEPSATLQVARTSTGASGQTSNTFMSGAPEEATLGLTSASGQGQSHNNTQPTLIAGTLYIKL